MVELGRRLLVIVGILLASCVAAFATPSVTNLSPNSGAVGASVTITGTNFGSTQADSTVAFNGTAATPTEWDATSIVVTVPTGTTTGNVVVMVDGVTSNGMLMTITGTSPPSRPVGSALDLSNPLTANLAGLFLMNEGSGTSDQNLVDNQVANFSGGSLPTWDTGGPAVVFAGGSSLSSYLNAGEDLTFDQLTTNQMTVVAKVYVSTLAAGGVCEKNDGNSVDSGFVFGWDSGGAMWLTVEKANANLRIGTGSGAITAGQWLQVAFTWDGTVGLASAGHLFVDGVEQTKATTTDGSGKLGYANATSQPFRIGNASFDTIAGAPNGKMAYLAVYKGRILTPTEMNQLDAQPPIVVSNDVTGTIAPNGSPASITTTVSGQGARLTFDGSIGQQATLQFSNNTMGSVTATLLAEGNTIASVTSAAGSFSLPQTRLPISGIDTVHIQPAGSTSGSITVLLTVSNAPARSVGSALDPSNPLTTNLAGLFLMNEGSGTSDQNLVDNQEANFSGGSLPTWDTGGPAIVFAGGNSLNSYLDAGTDLTFDQLTPDQMTVVARVYVNTLVPAGVCEKNDGNAVDSGFLFGWDNWGAMWLTVEKASANLRIGTGSGVITAAQWMQVAFTWDGTVGLASAGHLFLNGVEQTKATATDGSGTLGYANATNRPFRIGNASFDAIAGALNGEMAYLAVYKGRILTPTEMNQLDAQLPIVAYTGANVVIASITPNIGGSGTQVVLQGAGFGAAQGSSTVLFNGSNAGAATGWSSTSITANVPAGATTGNVMVTAGGVESNTVNFTVLPAITGLSRSSGPISAPVTLTGTQFGTAQGTVTFNGTAATLTSWSATSIVVTVPAGATTGNVVVTAGGLTSAGILFTVLPTPSITSLSPDSGPVGTPVTITGTNFGATQGTSTVTLNGTIATPTNWSATSIVVTVPAGTTTGNVVVTASGVASNAVLMMVLSTTPLPAVAQVQPAGGSANFPLNGRVVIRFTQPVQAMAIVPGTLSLAQGTSNIAGGVALSNDRLSLTFAPSQNLSANTAFTVVVQDIASSQSSPLFQSSFTTGSTSDTVTPQVVQTSPQDGSTGVPTSAPVVVQFSKPMDPATLTPQNVGVTDLVSGQAVSGMVQVDPTGTTASFVPQAFLGVDRQFQVVLSSTVQDSSGNSLSGSGAIFRFTTSFAADTTGPQMLGISPSNEATAFPLNGLVVLEFDKPLNIISVSSGFQVEANGQAVSGGVALSDSNKRITFTPLGGLAANTVYTVVTTSGILDVGGVPLSNPETFTLTTGATTDTTMPLIIGVSPVSGSTGVPTNAVVQLQLNKAIDPLTVTATTFEVYPASVPNAPPVPGTLSVSADGKTWTLVPTAPLDSSTMYVVVNLGGATDLEGQGLIGFESTFTTGFGAVTTAPSLATVSPANGATGVPVNVRLDVSMSVALDPDSVGNGSLTLSAAGTPVAGAVSLSTDLMTLTFVPGALLASSTAYTVTVSGVTDEAGNVVSPFTSSFTTGVLGLANTTAPSVVSVSPSDGSSAALVGSSVVLTFNEAIDATTVNNASVSISLSGASGVLAGTYQLDATGTILTFAPLSPLPASTTIAVHVNGSSVLDLSGNQGISFSSSFTTGTGTDTTAPTVVAVAPTNGATNVGLSAQVVLTFSKSLNPSTINTNNFALLVNGQRSSVGISTSADNRTVTLNGYGLPASSAVTVVATSAVTDFWGNSLENFESQFTTAPPMNTTQPAVFAQRPGNGAQGAPLTTSVVLYLSEAMNAASVQGALHVSQNGTLASGTTQVTDNGQVVQFTPTAPWQPNALVQVFLDSSALALGGTAISNYQSLFTTAAASSTIAPTVVNTSPPSGVNSVPTNAGIDFGFNEALDPATISPTTVLCYQNSAWIQGAVSLAGGGTVLHVVPRLLLQPNTSTTCQVSTDVQGLNGLAATASSLSFTTGSGSDSVIPTISTVSPPNGSVNVGDNANVRVVFSKPIDPLTINAGTVQLSGGGTTVVPDSISFSNGNQSVLLVPHAPLPDATQMTLTISGITDVAGNPVTAQTVNFTTETGPDVVAPLLVSSSPFQAGVNVPLNAVGTLQVNEPVDAGSVNGSTFIISEDATGQSVTGTYSVSTDGQTIMFLPSAPLAAGQGYHVYSGNRGIADLAGNLLASVGGVTEFSFTTGTAANTSAPQVAGVSPANGATAVPINAQVVIQFSEPVNAATLGGVTLSGSGGSANVSMSLSNGNQMLTLIPSVPFSPNGTFTLSIAGIHDLSGNVLAAPVTSSFTTSSGADLIAPTVASASPVDAASGVPTNASIQVQFNKQIDPLTVTNTTFQVVQAMTGIPATGTVAVSPDGKTATFTPSAPLDSLTYYQVQLARSISDLEGQTLSCCNSHFTTGQNTASLAPIVVSLNQTYAPVGSIVWIDGSYFGTSQASSTVTFNGVPATPQSWSDTQISVPVPSGATTGLLLVTEGGVASNSVMFTVTFAPSITGISPASATVGTVLTITGTNFGNSYDSTLVKFSSPNSLLVTPTSWTESSISVVVPATANSGNLFVQVDGASSGVVNFTLIPTPNITGLSPSSGVAGSTVNISGSGFGYTQGSSVVSFGGVPAASITSWTDGSIAAVVPSGVTTGPVTVLESSVPSNSNVVFTVASPTIASLSPPTAAIGATITLNGSGLTSLGLTTQVLFNGLPATIEQSSSSSVTVVVPDNATSGLVSVTVGSLTSNSIQFAVEQPPIITGVSPDYAQIGGWPIAITGSGFGASQSSSTVMFYGDISAQVLSWSDNEIQVVVPDLTSTGPINVQVGGVTGQGPWFYINAIVQLTDSLGNQSSYTSAMNGGAWTLSNSEGPGCSTCTVRGNQQDVSDAFGNTRTITDDLGNTATYTYDGSNNMASVSKPLNGTSATTSYTYNSFGEVLTMTDALGNTTTNAYDTKGNLLSVTSPHPTGGTAASVTQFQYDSKGELTRITDPLNRGTTLTYTSAGLIASITDAQSNTTTYQYDAQGDRTAVIDALHNQTSFAYDAMSRLTGISYPDRSTVGLTYDPRGRRTSVTDQNGRTTNYTYDDADRLTAVTDPASNITQYAYDTEGNLTGITDANGRTTSFAYDARGWVTQAAFPSSLAESYSYDAVGNLLSKTDRKGQTIQYVYDALYRLTQKTYPDSTSVEYVYDLAGKVQQVSDPSGVYGFAYDNMGRLIGTATQYAFLAGQTYTNAYTYDAASNRTSLTAPDGSTNTYSYDTLNRLSGLANSWAGTFGFGYDALSRRTSLTRPNGVNTSYSYDSLSHLLSVLHQAGNTTLDGASYTYDLAGNQTSKGNYLNGLTSNYSYDPLSQLLQVTGGTTESYSYDAVGNRLSSAGVSSYSYNASNELTSNSSGNYSYDTNGNTLTDASGKSYTWDFENRLVSATIPGTGTVTFKYDPFGRRIQKSSPLGGVNYLYDGDSGIQEIDTGGNVVARYSQGSGIDRPLAELRSGAASYYEADALGSVTSLTNAQGAVVNTYSYDSFGKLTASAGSITNPFEYTGREYDPETNLRFYRARYYDNGSGRFLSEDPIGFSGGTNFYSYTRNRPTRFGDPSGNCVDGIDTIFCILGGLAAAEIYTGYLNLNTSFQNLVNLANNYSAAMQNVIRQCSTLTGGSPEACQDAIELAARTRCSLLLGIKHNSFVAATSPGTFLGGDIPTTKSDLLAGSIQDQINQEAEKELEEEEKKPAKNGSSCCQR
jgi:RHS repeat-associated protein